ncbi:MAG: hypothetical protein Kow00108_00300 [Calditrichia bacterium]
MFNKMVKIVYTLALFLLMANSITAQSYPYQKGYAIRITTFPDTAAFLNRIFDINERGEAHLPVIGDVKISSMDEATFLLFLKNSYSKYVKATSFDVEVLYRVTLVGGFEDPGLYYARGDESLWSVVLKAGGFLEEKGFKKMKIYQGDKKIYDGLADEFSMGKTLREMSLKSGVIITVPIPTPPVDRFTRITQVMGIAVTTVAMYFTYMTLIVNSRQR